jgi:hypothetical protein
MLHDVLYTRLRESERFERPFFEPDEPPFIDEPLEETVCL